MSNRNDRSDESLVDLGSIEGQNIQAASRGENNNRNNANNRRRRRNNSNNRRPSDDTPSGIEQESDAEPEAENNQRNNANNRLHRTNSHTSDDNPPGIERVGNDAEEEGENIPVYEGNVSDEDGEAELFLQTMWPTSELLDHTAETSGLPMEGTVLAWRGNGPGKSVIVGYTCGGSVTARLIPAARRFIPSRAPNISEQSLGRRRDHIRTERDIQGWGIVAWRVDKSSVDQDPISLLKPMSRAWYPETYVYIHWWGGDASWESRETLRFVCASDELKTDMLIYNVAKEQEADYREVLTGVRPEYPAASTYMKNEHWRNVNAYRGAHWSQPRAERNRRITTIGYEPAFPREDNSQEFDSGIGMNDNGTFQEVREEHQEGYYEGSNEAEEMDNVEEVQDDREQRYGDVQQLRRDLSPIYEEVSEARSFFTPNASPTRVRWHGETQQRHGIFTPRATRSPSSGYIPQGNRDPARGMPETPTNRRVLHLDQGNQQRTPPFDQSDQRSQQRQTPQSNRSNRSNRANPGNQQRTPPLNQSDESSQQRQTPQSNRSNRLNQGNQPNQGNQQRTPQSGQGSQQRQTPQSNRSNQGNQPNQGNQQRTPQSNRSNRSNRANPGNQQRTPPLNQSDESSQQRQTPQSNRSNRSNQGNQPNQGNQQRTPQSSQGSQQRQTPQSNRSNRSNQGSQPNQGNQQRTPQSSQGSQQRQTPQSNPSNRSNPANPGNQQRTLPLNQSDESSQQRRTPQSNRSNQGNHIDHRSAESSMAVPEVNGGLAQLRRGRHRPRPWDRTTMGTRRSTRIASITERP